MTTDKPTDTDTPEDATTENTEMADQTDTGTDDTTQQAQSIMDDLADKPEVCKALYGMLQEKYQAEDNADSKSTAKPASYPAETFDTEGMPS